VISADTHTGWMEACEWRVTAVRSGPDDLGNVKLLNKKGPLERDLER